MFPIFVILGSCENHNFWNCSLQASLLSKASDSPLSCLLCFAALSCGFVHWLHSQHAWARTQLCRWLAVTLGMLRGLSARRCPCLWNGDCRVFLSSSCLRVECACVCNCTRVYVSLRALPAVCWRLFRCRCWLLLAALGCRGGRGGIGAQPPWALGNSGDIFSSFTSLTGGNREKKRCASKTVFSSLLTLKLE